MAKLKSSYLNIEFEVNAFESQENGDPIQIVSHESLEDIIHNQVPKEFQTKYDYNEMRIGRDHCVIRCTISDIAGRRVQAIGESVPETLETDISRCYPAVMAAQRAFDRAVIRYLGFSGKTLSNSEGVDNSGTDNGGTDVDVNAAMAEAAQAQNNQGAPAAQNAVPRTAGQPAQQQNGGQPQNYAGNPNIAQHGRGPAQRQNGGQPQNYAGNQNAQQTYAPPAQMGGYGAPQQNGGQPYQQPAAQMQNAAPPQTQYQQPQNATPPQGQQQPQNGNVRGRNTRTPQQNGTAGARNQQTPPQTAQPASNDPGAVICNCVGRYRGQNLTIAQVFQMDPQFIEWIAGAYQPVDENSANIKNASIAFLNIMRGC